MGELVITYRMNPEKCTDASSIGARWHAFRYLKVCKPGPNTSVVHAENREIFRLNGAHVALVRNRQRTALEFVKSMGMKSCSGRLGTRIVEIVRISNVTSL